MQKRILIVDDEAQIREIFKEAFEFEGFYVQEAPNGKVAFRLLQELRFDCVLSDVRMPGGDGVELAKKIQELPGPKPIIFLITGFADMNFEEVRDCGVTKIFDKPFDFQKVLEDVGQHLNPQA